jgi:hypothetical protein
MQSAYRNWLGIGKNGIAGLIAYFDDIFSKEAASAC